MAEPAAYLESLDDHLLLRVRAAPGAAQERVAGVHGEALKLAVRAPPEKGKANAAFVRLIAKVLGVSRTQVSLQSGETSKDKVFRIDGLSDYDAQTAIEKSLARG